MPSGICRPVGSHLSPRRLASAAPSARICHPVSSHLPPGGLASAAPSARICRPVGSHLVPGGLAETAQDELTVIDWYGDDPERMI